MKFDSTTKQKNVLTNVLKNQTALRFDVMRNVRQYIRFILHYSKTATGQDLRGCKTPPKTPLSIVWVGLHPCPGKRQNRGMAATVQPFGQEPVKYSFQSSVKDKNKKGKQRECVHTSQKMLVGEIPKPLQIKIICIFAFARKKNEFRF